VPAFPSRPRVGFDFPCDARPSGIHGGNPPLFALRAARLGFFFIRAWYTAAR
jgi:hypothetical protein